jgi:hypothetical protein
MFNKSRNMRWARHVTEREREREREREKVMHTKLGFETL